MNEDLVVVKRSPSPTDSNDVDVRQSDNGETDEAGGNVDSPASFMLLPLPLPIHLRNLSGKNPSKVSVEVPISQNRFVFVVGPVL